MTPIDPLQHRAILQQRGVSLAEWFVLSVVSSGSVPTREVANIASSNSEGDPRGFVTVQECQTAFIECQAKNLLRVIDRVSLREIRQSIPNKTIGPIYGYPKLGHTDFSARGAILYQKVSRQLFDDDWDLRSWYLKRSNNRIQLFFRNRKATLKAIDHWKNKQIICSVDTVVAIGTWYVFWWKCYKKGFRFSAKLISSIDDLHASISSVDD